MHSTRCELTGSDASMVLPARCFAEAIEAARSAHAALREGQRQVAAIEDGLWRLKATSHRMLELCIKLSEIFLDDRSFHTDSAPERQMAVLHPTAAIKDAGPWEEISA